LVFHKGRELFGHVIDYQFLKRDYAPFSWASHGNRQKRKNIRASSETSTSHTWALKNLTS
jgi:hypothetical protein